MKKITMNLISVFSIKNFFPVLLNFLLSFFLFYLFYYIEHSVFSDFEIIIYSSLSYVLLILFFINGLFVSNIFSYNLLTEKHTLRRTYKIKDFLRYLLWFLIGITITTSILAIQSLLLKTFAELDPFGMVISASLFIPFFIIDFIICCFLCSYLMILFPALIVDKMSLRKIFIKIKKRNKEFIIVFILGISVSLLLICGLFLFILLPVYFAYSGAINHSLFAFKQGLVIGECVLEQAVTRALIVNFAFLICSVLSIITNVFTLEGNVFYINFLRDK